MTFEFDNKGKFFTDVISKTPVPALVQTTTHLVQGTVHIRRGERFKDELDDDGYFLALTDAKIIGTDGQTLYQTNFLAIQRGQIVWIMPDEEQETDEDSK